MDRSRIWIIASIVAMVAVVIFGGLLGVQPQLTAASTANQERHAIAEQNVAKQAALQKLKTDFEKLPELKQTLEQLQQSVPPHADLPAFIDDLNALAAATATTVSGVTVSDAEPYLPPVPAPAATPAPGNSTSTPTPAPTASATATPAPKPTTPQAPAPVTNAKITGGNFVAIPIKVTVSGDYSQALAFVDGLQHGKRLFLVTAFASNGAAAAAAASTAGSSGAASTPTSSATSTATATDKATTTSGGATAEAEPVGPTSWTVSGYAYVLLDSANVAVPK
jgi:Tfp pilus assembly protein PilO